MATGKQPQGLILIELISVIVLVGIIASFTTFFLYSGIQGYLKTKNTSEGALNAQMALDRISLELRNLNYFTSSPVTSGNASLSYQSEVAELDGDRILKYDSTQETIAIDIDGTPYLLLENVTDFSLTVTPEDLNRDGVEDVASIGVGFHLHGIGKEFKTTIFPRHMVKNK
jgi:type II secretory pathway pseudopilin PulG